MAGLQQTAPGCSFPCKMKGPFFATTVSIRGGIAHTHSLVHCQLVLIVIYLDQAWKEFASI